MRKVDLLIKDANEIVTLKGPRRARKGKEMLDIGLVKRGFVAIDGGRIIDVGEDKPGYEAEEVISAKGKIVLPGFVDPHTHLVFSGYREFELDLKIRGYTYQEIAERGGGINYTVKLTRSASRERLVEEAGERIKNMISHGTTTCEAKSGYGLSLDDEIKILEVNRILADKYPVDIVSTFLGAHAIPEEYADSREKYLDLVVNEMIPEISRRGLARFCDVFCEKGYFDLKEAEKILTAGKRYGLLPKIHADEFNNLGCVSLACKLGCISADHLLKISDEEIPILSRSRTIAVLLPATVFSLMGKDFAPARKLIDSGCAVALGTDLNPNCYTENMQFVIQLACFYMRMRVEEALVASTLNSAYSIGVGDEVGSIEVGKKADIQIMNVPSYKFIPYHFGVNLVDTVIKSGKVIYGGS